MAARRYEVGYGEQSGGHWVVADMERLEAVFQTESMEDAIAECERLNGLGAALPSSAGQA
jgi:hypothetical protein